MREILCHVCGSPRYKIFQDFRNNRVVICESCGLFYTNPVPEEQVLIAQIKGSGDYTKDQLNKVQFFRNRASNLFDRVESIVPPGRVLDIGCAIGTALVVARERGWECTGIELSDSSVQIAKSQGLRIIQAELEQARLPGNSFDMVTVNHVLEHVSDPGPFLREIRRILRKEGLLFISVPNVHAWQFFLLRQNYSWTFHEHHFIHFSTDTLGLLLQRYGFTILELYTSRWRDFHNDLETHSYMFKIINNLIQKVGLGIEILCLAEKV